MGHADRYIYFGKWKYNVSQGVLSRQFSGEHYEGNFELPEIQQVLLMFFLNNPHRLVSKREISSILEPISILNESQIRKSISLLRTYLGDDNKNPEYIETVRKRGFRFIGSVNFVVSKTVCKQQHIYWYSFFSNLKKILLVLLPCCIVTAFSFFIYWFSYHPDVPYVESVNFSSVKGIEFEPSLSPDGNYLLYAGYLDSEKKHTIFLQNIHTKSIYILKSKIDIQLYGPVWFDGGSAILYQESELGKSCEIRKIEINWGDHSVLSDSFITDCGKYSYGSKLQVTADGKYLFYSSRSEINEQVSVNKYSFENGTYQRLTSPPSSGVGDYSIALSHDGMYLAFLRDATKTHAQLWLLDLSDGSANLLYESSDFYPVSVNWAINKKGLLVPSYTNEIKYFDVDSKKLSTIALTNNPFIQLTQLNNDTIIISGGIFWKSNFWKVNNRLSNPINSRVKAFDAESTSTILKVNHVANKPSAILSDRTGRLSLWFYYPDGRQIEFQKLVIKNNYAKGVFSPCGNNLLLLNGNQFWLIENEKNIRKLPMIYNASMYFSWSSDGRSIFYTSSYLGQEQVYKFNIFDEKSERLDPMIRHYEEVFDGSYYVQLRHDSFSLEIIKSDNSVLNLPVMGLQFSNYRNHILRRDGIYFYRKTDSGKLGIFRFNIHSGAIEDTGVTQNVTGRGIDVSLDELFIFTDDGMKGDIDLRVIEGLKI